MKPIAVSNTSWKNERYNKIQIIEWHVTKRCNFNCSYCDDFTANGGAFQYSHSMTDKHPSLEKMIKIVDNIESLGFYDIAWSISGGEPMVVPHFYEVLKYIRESDPHDITISTNGSIPLKQLIKCFGELDHLIMSLHFEFISHRIEEYKEKIVALDKFAKENGKKFTPRIQFPAGKFEMAKDMIIDGVDNYEFRNIIPLPDTPFIEGRNSYYNLAEEEELSKLRESETQYVKSVDLHYPDGSTRSSYPDEITLNDWHNFEGWTCRIGLDQLYIEPEGWVYRSKCRAGGILGNILDDNFVLPTDSIICPFDRCLDHVDITTPKAAPGYEHIVEDA